MAQIYLGIDCGTTGMKCMAVDENGRRIYVASRMHKTRSPHEGWLEQDPEGWLEPAFAVIRECAEAVGRDRIKAISFSGHMSSPVFLDHVNRPVYSCMTVGDARCKEQADRLLAEKEEAFRRAVGNKPLACFAAPKLLWFMDREPEKYQRTKTFVMAKDYLRYAMTGVLNTDPTDAGNTLLYEEKQNRWNRELIRQIGLREDLFPEVRQAADHVGAVREEIAARCGLNPGTAVYCGGADMACSQIGTGSLREGVLAVTLSTSGQVCMHISGRKEQGYGKLTFHPGILKDRGYAMGSVFSGGLALNWGYQMLSGCRHMTKEDLNKMNALASGAEKFPPGSDGVMFLPFLTGSGSPYFYPSDRAAFLGLSTTADQRVMFQAVMEGVSFHIRESVDVFRDMGERIRAVHLSGGGTRIRAWIRILTDILGMEVHIMEESDASTHGAALIAAAGGRGEQGLYELANGAVRIAETVKPDPGRVKQYERLYSIYKGYCRAIHEMYGLTERAG